jgi:methylphosphotriester-DNA--protein-cysteine methyltransferase
MQRLTRVLFVLHDDPAVRELLSQVPGDAYRVQTVNDWATLRQAALRAPLTAVAVVQPYGTEGAAHGLSEDLRDFVRTGPSLPVIAAFSVAATGGSELRTLLEWGVTDWLDLDREDTPKAVAHRLAAVRARPLQRMLQRALPLGVPSRTRHLLLIAADVVAAGGQAPDLATELGVADRTVPRWCERADLPPPRRLLAWLRLLLAAEMLDDPTRSVEALARACGYAGGASLKTGLRNLLSTTPRELREAGAFKTVADAFAAELFQLREASRQAGPRSKTWLH